MIKVKIDTTEFDELLLDVLDQACGVREESGNPMVEDGPPEIDTMCVSVYEKACDYLAEKGYLTTKNGRIYTIKNKLSK